jgi:hypothetical protein
LGKSRLPPRRQTSFLCDVGTVGLPPDRATSHKTLASSRRLREVREEKSFPTVSSFRAARIAGLQGATPLAAGGKKLVTGGHTLLDVILTLHRYNVYLILIAATIAGIFGIVLYITKKPVIRQWSILLIITLVLGMLQAVFGLLLVALGQKPGGGTGLYYLHYVYGGIVALGIPLVWLSFTTNGNDRRKDMLFYSIATLVVVAAAIRAWLTGPA